MQATKTMKTPSIALEQVLYQISHKDLPIAGLAEALTRMLGKDIGHTSVAHKALDILAEAVVTGRVGIVLRDQSIDPECIEPSKYIK